MKFRMGFDDVPDPWNYEDLGGGFELHRAPAGESVIVATALADTGVSGYCSPIEVDARLDADALHWISRHGWSKGRTLRSIAQVHGATILPAADMERSDSSDRPERSSGLPEADGVWTASHDDLLIVRTADCAPLWLVDPENGCFALLHVGWRGAAAGIVGAAAQELKEQGGDPVAFIAVVGPHLGRCCFEVGPEVAAHFVKIEGAIDPPDVLKAPRQRDDSVSLDLGAVLFSLLRDAGVPQRLIHIATACTRCSEDLLHSYRRNGQGGPLMASVGFIGA
jgi:polyphenol oxidase